jgi:hypothetical protein
MAPTDPFGGHRFYVGKAGSGILMAVTAGGMGVWWLYDLITVASGDFRDVDGRRVALWDRSGAEPHRGELPPLSGVRAVSSPARPRSRSADLLPAPPP